jgi:flagellin-specific chaperone FliS
MEEIKRREGFIEYRRFSIEEKQDGGDGRYPPIKEAAKSLVGEAIEKADLNKAREILNSIRVQFGEEFGDNIAKELAWRYIKEGEFERALTAADLIEDETTRQEVLKEIDNKIK